MSSNLLLIPLCIFHFNLFYSLPLIGNFLIFSLFVEVLTVFVHFSLKFSEHLYDNYFELFYRIDCLSPFHLILFLMFYFVLWFGIYSSVSSFCLILCVCYCILGRSAMLCLPVLKRCLKWVMFYGTKQSNPRWLLEPAAPGLFPVWAACTLLLCR